MKAIQAILATCVYLVLLVCVYYLHVQYFKINVVFYAAIADGIIAAALSGVLLLLVCSFSKLTRFEILLLITIWLLGGYSYAISVPTVIDRSLSFYILEKVKQRGGGIRQDAFEYIFTQEYVKEHHLVDVRLTEQLASGTIVIENGCVKLTPKGEDLVKFSRYFRQNWLPKERLLMGKYTDALTDPFRHSEQRVDYTCK